MSVNRVKNEEPPSQERSKKCLHSFCSFQLRRSPMATRIFDPTHKSKKVDARTRISPRTRICSTDGARPTHGSTTANTVCGNAQKANSRSLAEATKVGRNNVANPPLPREPNFTQSWARFQGARTNWHPVSACTALIAARQKPQKPRTTEKFGAKSMARCPCSAVVQTTTVTTATH